MGIVLCPTDSEDLARDVLSEQQFEDYIATLQKRA